MLIKASQVPFQFRHRLRLLSAHGSGGGFSQAACIDDLCSQKAGERKGKETGGKLVQTKKVSTAAFKHPFCSCLEASAQILHAITDCKVP